MKSLSHKFIVVGLFAIAMGFLEAVVVVYLREIYYPDGFKFPLALIDSNILGIELVRELTTLVMLVSIGLLVGKTKNEKFAWFLFTFGVWDIFYYVGLKAFLNWPESLLTWDILFLIPVTWIGPVLAPVICSVTMIILAIVVIPATQNSRPIRFGKLSWIMLILGAGIIFVSFIEDYTLLLFNEGYFAGNGPSLSEAILNKAVINFIPAQFNWWLFMFGEILIILGIIKIIRDKNPDTDS